jgi:hypothetical protein
MEYSIPLSFITKNHGDGSPDHFFTQRSFILSWHTLLLLVRLQIYTFGFAACKQELILNTPNSSKENDQENRIPRDHSHFRRYGLSQNGTWCCKTENEVLQNRIFLK